MHLAPHCALMAAFVSVAISLQLLTSVLLLLDTVIQLRTNLPSLYPDL